MSYFDRQRLSKWDESKVNRGKTVPGTNSGSFAPKDGDGSEEEQAQGGRYPERMIPDEQGRYDVHGDVNLAVQLLAEGKKVILEQPREVSTLLDRLNEVVQDFVSRGEKAPVFNLCNVSVPGTNLFCAENRGYPRVRMPQLKGHATPGSKAAGLPTDVRGEVDLSGPFRQHLQGLGIAVEDGEEGAAYLRASQNELNGAKVAGIAKAYMEGNLADESLFVSRDNYIIDGHHRWGAQVAVSYASNTFVPVKITRIDADIVFLLEEAKRFAKDWGLPQADVSKSLPCAGGACAARWEFL